MLEDVVIRAPELPQDFVWLNTPAPLSLRALRGHVVILDFWTYCCVNCMHVVPVLEALEARHRGDPLVVIGVHSAKFEGERDPERIADAIARYGVHHPVVVDREMKIWSDFAVRSWPTLVVVRPDGTIGAVAPGEPDPAILEQVVSAELERGRARGTLAREPIRTEQATAAAGGETLSFPGKLAVARDGRLAVSDSGHHRVLVLSSEGEVLAAIGSGAQGHRDGAFTEAELDDPQGLCFDPSGRALYVADARNHVVLRADLEEGTVTTIAGDGTLGAAAIDAARPARETALRSPWDLAYARRQREGETGDLLYVALAGSHQIAVLDLARSTIARVAGTGAESMIDGPLDQATFSQPSGLALAADHALWVADSETSALRLVDFHHGTVRTVVGAGLFDFGDVDGPPDKARLQHCLGVTVQDAAPIVADTYNHKLKAVDPRTGEARTLFSGADGHILREPGGVAWDASRGAFLVADTGHHRLLEISLDGGKARVLPIRGAPAVAPPRAREVAAPAPLRSEEKRGGYATTSWFDAAIPESTPLAPGDASLVVRLVPRGGLHLAVGSPLRLAIEVSRRSDLLVPRQLTLAWDVADADAAVLEVPVHVGALPSPSIAAEVLLTIECVTCADGGLGTPAACIPLRSLVRLPVRLAADGAHEARFDIPVGDPG
ncbi:MAG: redoxin domain-containing protein [Deltaproteobacteria bacterium]|nr:redoxin domain-containing protein [Deltaproteobacteria bacterium]